MPTEVIDAVETLLVIQSDRVSMRAADSISDFITSD